MNWSDELVQWLQTRGYVRHESGPINPATGRGWYSHPCEYKRGHVRIRINPGGIIILRDPGCTMEITRIAKGTGGMQEFVTPNTHRLDYPHVAIDAMQRQIERFESRPAYTAAEAREHFFGEVAAHEPANQ